MLDTVFPIDTSAYGIDRFKADLARIPSSLTDAEARAMVTRLRKAVRKAEAAAMKARAPQVEPTPCAMGIGVVGLLAR